jgi:hypothetical protein
MLDVERNERGRGGADEDLTTMIMGGFAEGGLRNGQEGRGREVTCKGMVVRLTQSELVNVP